MEPARSDRAVWAGWPEICKWQVVLAGISELGRQRDRDRDYNWLSICSTGRHLWWPFLTVSGPWEARKVSPETPRLIIFRITWLLPFWSRGKFFLSCAKYVYSGGRKWFLCRRNSGVSILFVHPEGTAETLANNALRRPLPTSRVKVVFIKFWCENGM